MRERLSELELACLGPPIVRLDGGEPPPEVVWRKHVALLVYLALSPDGSRTREHVIGLLWPDKPQDRARHSLNEAIRRLRAALGADRLHSDGDALALNRSRLVLDIDALARASDDPEAALAMVRGEFLEGFVLDDATPFEEWVGRQRLRYGEQVMGHLLTLGERALHERQLDAAVRWAREALGRDPMSEPAADLLLRAYAHAGNATGALATFHEFAARLETEIGEQPGLELTALAERIRAGRWRRVARASGAAPVPLVGRPDVHRALFEALDRGLTGEAQCIVIAGEPGMGKTRLLDECAAHLALGGAHVVTARPMETDEDAAWSLLRQMGAAGLTTAPGAAGTAPQALAALAWLLPDLADRVTPREPRDTADTGQALQSLVTAIADEQPLALLVDDAHFGDSRSLAALGGLATSRGMRHMVVVLALDEARMHVAGAVSAVLGGLGRQVPGRLIRLRPLDESEMRALVGHLAPWCTTDEMTDRLARRLVREAGGNPFYAVTLLDGLDRTATLRDDLLGWPERQSTLESPLPFSVPDLARMAIVARVAQLDENAGLALRAAAIGGRAVDIPLVAALVDQPTDWVEAQLERLEEARFVRFDGRRYVFTADIVVKVVRGECLTPGRRHRLRRRAIEVLADREDLEGAVLRTELEAKVSGDAETYHDAMRLAREAARLGALRMARRALFAAESVAPDDAARQEAKDVRSTLGA
jgi:DNA-binding SARP family transcriptional activator